MTDQREDGMYECPSCERRETTELFLMYCCRDEYDKPSFQRGYELGNN